LKARSTCIEFFIFTDLYMVDGCQACNAQVGLVLKEPKTITNGANQWFVFQAESKMNSVTALAAWAFSIISSASILLQEYSLYIFSTQADII
jgi:hypothetical protein